MARGGAAPAEATALAGDEDGADRATGPASSDLRANSGRIRDDRSGDDKEADGKNDWILNQVQNDTRGESGF